MSVPHFPADNTNPSADNNFDNNGPKNGVLLQNTSPIPGENPIFATNREIKHGGFVAKIPSSLSLSRDSEQISRQQELATVVQGSPRDIQEMLAAVVTNEEVMTVAGRGRPGALDAARKQRICILLKIGYTRSLAAAELGIARSTITRNMQRDPDFQCQVLQAEELYERLPLLTIMQAAKTDWRAAVWLMKHHRPHTSVARRKRAAELRRSGREVKAWFEMADEAMKVTPPEERKSSTTSRMKSTGKGSSRPGRDR